MQANCKASLCISIEGDCILTHLSLLYHSASWTDVFQHRIVSAAAQVQIGRKRLRIGRIQIIPPGQDRGSPNGNGPPWLGRAVDEFPAITYSRPRRTTMGPGCLTAVFGMGTGGTIQVSSPGK